jgi:Selenocysteine lyase
LNVEGLESTEVSYILDKKYGIETRAGLHCAPMAHTTLGTLKSGIVRFSFSYFNVIEEIEYTVGALEKISKGI